MFPDILDICAPVPCPGSEQSQGQAEEENRSSWLPALKQAQA